MEMCDGEIKTIHIDYSILLTVSIIVILKSFNPFELIGFHNKFSPESNHSKTTTMFILLN
jgi:hypothetical protein